MVPAQYAPVLEKLAFAVTGEGHKFDAEAYQLMARQAAERAAHEQQYGALPTSGEKPQIGRGLRFGLAHGDTGRPDVKARHYEYAAKKHQQGKNAWNPFGGILTPSSFEDEGATTGLLSRLGKSKAVAPEFQKVAKKDDFPKDVNKPELIDNEVKANMKDNRKSLTDLFDSAKDHSVSKYFPGKTEKVTSDPFLKVAFAHAMGRSHFRKTAGQRGVMFIGFQDELAKIANVPAIPGQAAGGAGGPAGLPSMAGFKSLAGSHAGAGAGQGLAGGFGKALGNVGKAVSAVR
jgi:hypothetical protein